MQCIGNTSDRSRRRLAPTLLVFLALVIPHRADSQTPAVPSYDIVSIAPNKSGSGSISWKSQDASFTATNLTLEMLVSLAFGVRQDLISGLPSWAKSNQYDVQAKIVDPDLPALKKLTEKQHNSMLQAILADRFKLKAHVETKQLPVYDLVVTPQGPKFKASSIQDSTKGGWSSSSGAFTGSIIHIAELTDFLANQLHKPVEDRTGLSANYDLQLKWTPDRAASDAGLSFSENADSGPSLFTALVDQLGLRLVPNHGSVGVLVVDHVELPSPN